MEGLEQNDVGDFFDKLSDDDDKMPGVEEAEEAPDPKKKKVVKAKATISNRIVLNERLLCGPKGLVKYLSHFKGMKLSSEKDSEYKNLQVLMSRLERWTHQLYPKWQLDTSLAKIESMGNKGLVKNTIRRIRTNEVLDELDGMGMPKEDVTRRGEDDDDNDDDPFNDAPIPEDLFDQVTKNPVSTGEKRAASSVEGQPPPKKQITDEQRARMEANRARALEKKRQRELANEMSQT